MLLWAELEGLNKHKHISEYVNLMLKSHSILALNPEFMITTVKMEILCRRFCAVISGMSVAFYSITLCFIP